MRKLAAAPIFTARQRRRRRTRIVVAVLSVNVVVISAGVLRLQPWRHVPVPRAAVPAEDSRAVEKAVTIELGDGGHTHPKQVRLPVGSRIRLTVENGSTAAHDFILERLGLHVDVDPGARGWDSSPLVSPGTYRSWCSQEGHTEGVTFFVS